MTKLEYLGAIKKQLNENEEHIRKVRENYTQSHFGNIRIGDIIDNGSSAIRVTNIYHGRVSFDGDLPIARFKGTMVTMKDHVDFKRHKELTISSPYIKNHFQKAGGNNQ